MENNMFNMNQVSKKTIENNKRIEKQTNDYLNEYYAKQRADKAAEEEALNEAAMSGARFGFASSIARSKNRVRALEEEINYTNNAVTIAMSEMISQVVEAGLLLDEAEYAKLDPSYKDDIRTVVHSLLENANVETTTNPDTLTLMSYVSKELPPVETGKFLTEEEVRSIFKKDKPAVVEEAIKRLSGNVSDRVAMLVEKEQKKVNQIQKEIDEVAGPDAEPMVPQDQAAPAEEMPAEDVPVDENGNPIDPNAMPAEGEELPPEEAGIDPATMGGEPMPKKQIQMLPDGTLNVNIYEDVLVRETPRCGLLESLAVNEAMTMLDEGKEYNADLCLAKAITYVTVTEALDTLGLVKVDDVAYAKVIANAGGNLLESKRSVVRKRKKAQQLMAEADAEEAKEEAKSAAKLAKAVKKGKPMEAQSLAESYTTQWTPHLNKSNDGLDLAERIRQKRLLQEKKTESVSTEEVLDEGFKESVSLFAVKHAPEFALDAALKKAAKKLESKKPENYKKGIEKINEILGLSKEEKRDFMIKCIEAASNKDKKEADKELEKNAKKAKEADVLTEGADLSKLGIAGSISAGTGGGVAMGAGLVGIGYAIAGGAAITWSAVPMVIFISVISTLIVAGIAAIIADVVINNTML